MISVENMTDEDLERHAFEVLRRELGPDGLARFIRLNRAGSGDYTRDRHKWLGNTTIQEIMAELETQRDPAG